MVVHVGRESDQSGHGDRLTDGGEVLERARQYVAEVVLPRAKELDAEPDPEQAFSWEFMEQADQYGLRTLRLSRENGGSGLGFRAVMNVVREVAKGDAGVAAQLAQLNHLSRLVEVAGTPEQVHEYLLPAFLENPRFVLAIGSTEPDIGSDAQYPPAQPVRYQTTAERRDGAGY
jgi:alkylation response protein AidB-like acyl-CoA dehydrogenase